MTLITISEAARILGIGRTTAYRLAKEGRIPCVRSFGPLRVHAERLQALIDAELDQAVTEVPPRAVVKPSVRQRSPDAAAHKLNELLKPQSDKKMS